MNTTRLEVMITKLRERTETMDVSWEKTESENQFQTVLGPYVIRIIEVPAEGPEPDYILRILDAEGSIIESASDVAIHQQNPDFRAFQVMSEVFRLARRSSMGADKAIESIIRELDEIPIF